MGDSAGEILCQQLVEQAQAAGAQAAEAYLQEGEELQVEVRNGQVETLKRAGNRGVGLRVLQEGRLGFAYSADLAPEALADLVRRALECARYVPPDEWHRFPGAAEYPQLELYDAEIGGRPVEEKIELARAVESEARAADPRVRITEACSYQDASYRVTLANSHGLLASYRGAYCGLYAYVVAVEGADQQTGFGLSYSLRYGDLDPARVGREAARRAVRLLGAKRPSTRRVPVILDPYVATQFLGLLAPALSAEAVQKGRSLLAGRVGEQVASPLVHVVDDGRRPGGIGSAPFDGEGVPSQRTELVSAGVLRGFLHNVYTAARDGVSSTGNGTRYSFKGTPQVGSTNFYLEAGATPAQALLSEVTDGVYVTEVMGMHTANPVSGDFSVGAAGLLVERGECTRPVRGIAIAGNILELFAGVDAVGDDLTFFGGRGAPTLRLRGLTVSGD